MTTGAVSSPLRHHIVEGKAERSRSPSPTQQMRAGKPWNLIRSLRHVQPAMEVRVGGEHLLHVASVAGMSSGLPESAAQRKGPTPRQKSGRI